jgi:hypothetical protein
MNEFHFFIYSSSLSLNREKHDYYLYISFFHNENVLLLQFFKNPRTDIIWSVNNTLPAVKVFSYPASVLK